MTTIAEHLEEFLIDMMHRRKLRPNTIRAYRYDLQGAAIALSMDFDAISIEDIEQWLYDDHRAASTSERRASSLARFFAWAQRHGLCLTDPTRLREPGHVTRRLPKPIRSPDHLKRLDVAIQTMAQPYRLIFTILRETGMRASEVLNLNIADVHLQIGCESLRLRQTKNGFERSVILEPNATPRTIRGLRAWLRKHTDRGTHVALFCSNRKTRMTYSALYHQWHRLCVAHEFVNSDGTPLYTIHQLRHTRATELIEQGLRIEIVQRILGHRDPRSTQGYAELSEMMVRSALANHK